MAHPVSVSVPEPLLVIAKRTGTETETETGDQPPASTYLSMATATPS
jgi:hypothetical protein